MNTIVRAARAHSSFARPAACILLGLAFTCGDAVEADADMNGDLDRVFEHADLVDREFDTHASAITAPTDASDVEAAEGAHRDSMGPHMSDLDHMLIDMTRFCRHRATQESGRTHEMQAAMKALRDEMERHRLAPRPNAPAARVEEEKHVRESRGILRTMRDAGTRMRHEAGFYRCQHGNH